MPLSRSPVSPFYCLLFLLGINHSVLTSKGMIIFELQTLSMKKCRENLRPRTMLYTSTVECKCALYRHLGPPAISIALIQAEIEVAHRWMTASERDGLVLSYSHLLTPTLPPRHTFQAQVAEACQTAAVTHLCSVLALQCYELVKNCLASQSQLPLSKEKARPHAHFSNCLFSQILAL